MDGIEARSSGGAAYEGRTERITDPARVAGLLANLREGRSFLTITIEDAPGTYGSALLEIHPEKGYVVLDELTPRRGHERVAPARRLHAYTRIRGVELHFTGEVQAILDDGEAMAYRLAFPAFVDYRQRRAHFRARLRRGRRIPVALLADTDEPVRGELRDISVGGIGAEFRPPLPEALVPGARVAGRLDLPETSLACAIEICFVNRSLVSRSVVVGARFVDLEPAHQKRIAQLVAAVECEAIRHDPARR